MDVLANCKKIYGYINISTSLDEAIYDGLNEKDESYKKIIYWIDPENMI